MVTIPANTTALWDDPNDAAGAEDGVYIEAGAYLKISNLTITLNQGKSIELGDDAALYVTYSTINSGYSVSGTFAAIKLNGNNNTRVTFHHSILNNAERGIMALNGGRINARYSEFYNCKIGIKISDYNYSNLIHIYKNSFAWNSTVANLKAFIILSNTSNIRIYGNSFENIRSSGSKTYYMTGIKILNSSAFIGRDGISYYSIPPNCFGHKGDDNSFENLSIGISIKNTNAPSAQVSILESTFLNCQNGIKEEDDHNSIIYGNIFHIVDEVPLDPRGIHLKNSTDFKIIENKFLWDFDECPNGYFSGIYLEDCDPVSSNLIKSLGYFNKFTYNSDCASHAYGLEFQSLVDNDKTNIDCECNIFENLLKDISIATSTNSGIIDQGSLSKDPSNKFSITPSLRKNISNGSNPLSYYTYYYLTPSSLFNPDQIYGSVTISQSTVQPLDPCDNYAKCDIYGQTVLWEESLLWQSTDGQGDIIDDFHNNYRVFDPNYQTFGPIYKKQPKFSSDELPKGQIAVYPNPAYDILTIELNKEEWSEIQSVSIYNLHGKLIETYKIKDSWLQIDVSTYQSGLYFVKAIGNNNVEYKSKFEITK